MSNEMNTQEENRVLTQKDLNKAMFRWYMSAEMPLNFENMQEIHWHYSYYYCSLDIVSVS